MSREDGETKQKTVIIVGAGVAGTALAARLSRAGLKVTVVEKNGFTGGRCSLIQTSDGYRFDRGPSLLLLPKLFQETFLDLGTTLQDEGIRLVRCDPNCEFWSNCSTVALRDVILDDFLLSTVLYSQISCTTEMARRWSLART